MSALFVVLAVLFLVVGLASLIACVVRSINGARFGGGILGDPGDGQWGLVLLALIAVGIGLLLVWFGGGLTPRAD
ncbi:MAG: hypothetical protein LBC97_07655 [Bifidobacteriaceae bacterium]|jgi:hypothetical protein|nr:hypothetical protein [Bifidobacteriaceae bacterium]